jgi:RNA polymerase subunit RPABC4/transcription elongation factor Spt4
MSAICPNGHTSGTDDFCDVCGAPITAAAPSITVTPAVTATPAVAGMKACPNCSAANVGDALFCEDCGYDFATGQLPPPVAVVDPSSGVIAPAMVVSPPIQPAQPALAGVDWVAEVWVDSDWFAFQQSEGACPTSGLPTVVPLRGPRALIGRRSRSRGLAPEIDCSADGAISHSHAELDLGGGRWTVTDLGSTNGTYVGRPDGTYPAQPLPVRQAHELADDERIYLGAWTRIVVRASTDSERAGSA